MTPTQKAQIESLRKMMETDEGALVILLVFQERSQSEINEAMHRFVEALAV